MTNKESIAHNASAQRDLHNYTLIKALYDQGQDYIDCFWPFVIQVTPADEFVDQPYIQSQLERSLDVAMPLHVLNSAVRKAISKRLVVPQKGTRKYRLTDKGTKYKNRIEGRKDVERRIKSLIERMVGFFQKANIQLTEAEALLLIHSFVQSNRQYVVAFLNPNIPTPPFTPMKTEPHNDILLRFLNKVDASEPEYYATLRDMLLVSCHACIVV